MKSINKPKNDSNTLGITLATGNKNTKNTKNTTNID
jgi:hypothetical protein